MISGGDQERTIVTACLVKYPVHGAEGGFGLSTPEHHVIHIPIQHNEIHRVFCTLELLQYLHLHGPIVFLVVRLVGGLELEIRQERKRHGIR